MPKLDLGISLSLGDLPIGGYGGEVPFPLPAKGDRASFNIFFGARNGSWTETLRLRRRVLAGRLVSIRQGSRVRARTEDGTQEPAHARVLRQSCLGVRFVSLLHAARVRHRRRRSRHPRATLWRIRRTTT